MQRTITHPVPLERVPLHRLAAVRLLATDVDGTITRDGKLPAEVLTDMARLEEAGIEVIPVTGRSAGEALALARYLPGVRRAVAENGLVAVEADRPLRLLCDPVDRQQLLQSAQRLFCELPPAPCTDFRCADVALERGDLDEATLAALARRAQGAGLHATWSSVHFHLCAAPPDKGAGLRALLAGEEWRPATLATIGDAVNDAGLWRAMGAGLAVGTQEVLAVWDQLPGDARPEVVTGPGSEGWRALVAAVLAAR